MLVQPGIETSELDKLRSAIETLLHVFVQPEQASELPDSELKSAMEKLLKDTKFHDEERLKQLSGAECFEIDSRDVNPLLQLKPRANGGEHNILRPLLHGEQK